CTSPRFFFSSRRRHTRFSRDWSSDVCSSDLRVLDRAGRQAAPPRGPAGSGAAGSPGGDGTGAGGAPAAAHRVGDGAGVLQLAAVFLPGAAENRRGARGAAAGPAPHAGGPAGLGAGGPAV